MTLFQILGVCFASLAVIATLSAAARHRMSRGTAMAWTLVWITAIATIAFPQLTVTVAQFLGISRGADLVFYCAILAMIFGFFLTFVRLRRLETSLTKLIRHLAIQSAQLPPQTPGSPNEASEQNQIKDPP